jgi:hypothetical protein
MLILTGREVLAQGGEERFGRVPPHQLIHQAAENPTVILDIQLAGPEYLGRAVSIIHLQ